ncbi:MAG TPA: hypothetical protein VD886_15745 [Herpetosiphonaceae bacterium]|nr:hypothetical protein [Herpetosiphonaceae bacterium]
MKDGLIIVGARAASLACVAVVGGLWVWAVILYSVFGGGAMFLAGLCLLMAVAAWAGWRGRTGLAVMLSGLACIPGCYFLLANSVFALVGVSTIVQFAAGVLLEIINNLTIKRLAEHS